MRRLIKTACTTVLFGGLVLSANPVKAQSAEETINVGVDVQIEQSSTQIIRLDDISMSINIEQEPSGTVHQSDFFCLHIPADNEVILQTTGANIYTEDEELLALTESQTGELKQLSYRLIINVLTSDGPGQLVNTNNRVNSASLSALNLFANEDNCGGSENMEIRISVGNLNTLSPMIPNTGVIRSLPSGPTYNFSDQLTIIVTPVI